MSLTQLAKLILEGISLVMFFLVGDVASHLNHLGFNHFEVSVFDVLIMSMIATLRESKHMM